MSCFYWLEGWQYNFINSFNNDTKLDLWEFSTTERQVYSFLMTKEIIAPEKKLANVLVFVFRGMPKTIKWLNSCQSTADQQLQQLSVN